MKLDQINTLQSSLRIELLKMIYRSGFGRITPSLAVLDLLMALYLGENGGRLILNYDLKKPQADSRDYVVFSDEALSPAHYLCLREAGFALKGPLQRRPTLKMAGMDAPILPAGMSLSVAYGLAKSLSLEKRQNRVYVFLNDVDFCRGEFWESAMQISYDRLDHLVVICSTTRLTKLNSLQEKFEAFGWKVLPLVDGHDVDEIIGAIVKAKVASRRPTLILAPTVLGKGIFFAEGKDVYANVSFSEEEMTVALESLQP